LKHFPLIWLFVLTGQGLLHLSLLLQSTAQFESLIAARDRIIELFPYQHLLMGLLHRQHCHQHFQLHLLNEDQEAFLVRQQKILSSFDAF